MDFTQLTLTYSETTVIFPRLSRTNRHKVIKSENSPVFFAHPVYCFDHHKLKKSD